MFVLVSGGGPFPKAAPWLQGKWQFSSIYAIAYIPYIGLFLLVPHLLVLALSLHTHWHAHYNDVTTCCVYNLVNFSPLLSATVSIVCVPIIPQLICIGLTRVTLFKL